MKTVNKQIKPTISRQVISGLLWFLVIGFYLITSYKSYGQRLLDCNYKAGDFSMTLEGHTTGVGFTSRLVLTDTTGKIQYVTAANSTTFQHVIQGNYLAYGITYQNSVYVPSLTVGQNINLVGACYKTVVVPTRVCDCNNSTGNLNASLVTPPVGKQVNYVLTDGKGTILLIKTSPTFEGNPDGVYNILAVTYQANTYPSNFEIGKNINTVSGIDLTINQSSSAVVCLIQKPLLSLIKKAPLTANIGEEFTYTFDITNIGNVPTSETITLSDTLVQGLSFQSVGSLSDGWACQSTIVIVNNTARTLVSCISSQPLLANQNQQLTIKVVTQKAGIFNNQAFIDGGGITTSVPSNKVQTTVKDKDGCQEVCIPYVIVKNKKRKA